MFKKSFMFGLFGSMLISGVISSILAIHSSAQGADNAVSVELLMQKAYYAQRSEGDMEKAIDLYSQVIAQNAADRQYAGQACFELGQCYQNLGDNAKAIGYFRKVVTDYKDVEKWQKKAAAKLVELGDIADSSDPGVRMINNVPAEVKVAIGDLVAGLVQEAQALQCIFNCHYYIVEDDLSVSAGVIGLITNDKETPLTGKVHRGVSSSNNYRFYTVDGRPLATDFVPATGRKNLWNVYLTLPEPMLAGGQLHYVTISDSKHNTSRDDKGNVVFTMQNNVGVKCLEAFFLITSSDMELVSKSDEYTEKVTAGGCNIYNFKKLMVYGENHRVEVKVSGNGNEKVADMPAPQLLPVPWSDGDSFKLDVRLLTGVSGGSLSYSFNKIEKDGKKYWQIVGEQNVDLGKGASAQKTVVLADIETYRPVYGSTENKFGTFVADYSEKKVSLKVKDGEPKDIEVAGPVFDNEQVLCMLRLLPLAENYACKFDIFPVLGGVVIECQIKVIATETLTVPAGEFTCYRITLSCWSGDVKFLEHNIWIEQEGKHNIVKYDAGAVEMVLTEINGKAPVVADIDKQKQDKARSKVVEVISTSPAAYDNAVSVSLDKLEVTFSQTMKDGGWSWTGGGDTFPESAGSISYDSKRRTCRMPVKLQPGKVYWVGINSPSHKNFKSAKGEPAKRYVILFATAGADGSPTEIPADLLDKAKAINAN